MGAPAAVKAWYVTEPTVEQARRMVVRADRTAAVKVGDGARMIFGSRDGEVVMSAFDSSKDGHRLMIRRLRLSDGVHALVVAERLIDGEVTEKVEAVDLWEPVEAG